MSGSRRTLNSSRARLKSIRRSEAATGGRRDLGRRDHCRHSPVPFSRVFSGSRSDSVSTWFLARSPRTRTSSPRSVRCPVRGRGTLGGVVQDRAFDATANVEVATTRMTLRYCSTVSLGGGRRRTLDNLQRSRSRKWLVILLDAPAARSAHGRCVGRRRRCWPHAQAHSIERSEIAHAIATALRAQTRGWPPRAIWRASARATDAAGAASAHNRSGYPGPTTTREPRGRQPLARSPCSTAAAILRGCPRAGPERK